MSSDVYKAQQFLKTQVSQYHNIAIGSVAATTKINWRVPANCTLQAIYDQGSTVQAANDTNYWTWTAVNKGSAGAGSTALLAATDANTTKATGGTAISANVARALTVHGTAANLVLTEGDIIEFVITKTASPTTREGVTFQVKTIGR